MITDEYRKTLNKIHKETNFGKRGKIPKSLKSFIDEVKPKSLIDFGCGKGRLLTTLKEEYNQIKVTGYDPGNTDFDTPIDDHFVDLLISTDVLEHIEPEFLETTISFLSQRSRYFWHLIALSPAKRILPDGRNAHLIQESQEWWRDKFLNTGCKIIKEGYKESQKIISSSNLSMTTKHYLIIGENQWAT